MNIENIKYQIHDRFIYPESSFWKSCDVDADGQIFKHACIEVWQKAVQNTYSLTNITMSRINESIELQLHEEDTYYKS